MKNCKPKDCLFAPFPSECFDFCIEKLLSIATVEQKIQILKISEETAFAIKRVYSNQFISSFSTLKKYLTSNQVEEIESVFQNINQSQLDSILGKG